MSASSAQSSASASQDDSSVVEFSSKGGSVSNIMVWGFAAVALVGVLLLAVVVLRKD